jgi:hypothetical protein
MDLLTKTSNSPTMLGLNRLIEQMQKQVMRCDAMITPRAGTEEDESDPSRARDLERIDLFLARLQQIKEWLEHDSHLLNIVDYHISQHLRAIEKRQRRAEIWLAVITTISGALLGWLISVLASPITIWHLFVH